MPRVRKQYCAGGRSGCVEIRRSRVTGTLVGVYHAEQAHLDSDGGPWVTVCEEHGELVNHASLAAARWFRTDPREFCEGCRKAHTENPPRGT